jgi:hypothetical protein
MGIPSDRPAMRSEGTRLAAGMARKGQKQSAGERPNNAHDSRARERAGLPSWGLDYGAWHSALRNLRLLLAKDVVLGSP